MTASSFRRVQTFVSETSRKYTNIPELARLLLRDQIMEVKSGTDLTKIEPKRKPVKYSRGGAQRRSSRV